MIQFQVFCGTPRRKVYLDRGLLDVRVKDKSLYRYHCSYCGKRFNSTGNLRGHLAVHTGLREFKCVDCKKEFAYKTHLTVHRRKYHGDYAAVENSTIQVCILGNDFQGRPEVGDNSAEPTLSLVSDDDKNGC